jgi:DNA-binding response OmpR family regulator
MTPHPSVLIGLSGHGARRQAQRERIAGWVRHLGYEPTVTEDGAAALAWVRDHVFAAHLLDEQLGTDSGERVWRRVRPVLGRRLVLMVEEPRTNHWFEALRAGVGAVLPLPPREATVRAAIVAATGMLPVGTGRRTWGGGAT